MKGMDHHTPKVSFFSDITVFSLGDYEIGPVRSRDKTHVYLERTSTGEGINTSKEELYRAIHEAIEKYFEREIGYYEGMVK